jgi:hypothetical protein
MIASSFIYFVLFTDLFPALEVWLINLPFISQLLTQFYIF